MSTERVVRDAEATLVTGLGRSQRAELTSAGLFPQKVALGERASGYLHSELLAWVAARPRKTSKIGRELAAAKKAKRQARELAAAGKPKPKRQARATGGAS